MSDDVRDWLAADGRLTNPDRRRVLEGAAVGIGLCATPSAAALAFPIPTSASPGAFPLISDATPAAVIVEGGADPAVRHAADGLAEDLRRVSGRDAIRYAETEAALGPVVLIGVLGASPAIDRLVAAGRIDVRGLLGEWEAFRQIVLERPFPGVPRALVIVGSDRRGAVYGAYDLSERMGVSPWHWFADVPVDRRRSLFIPAGMPHDQPRIRYRGFFINDEDPCLSSWAKQQFGGVNAKMYAHIFELLLRLKGNYLWPAMWSPKAFADDDPQSMILADEMGVVMGNSHHEPMLRAQDEWHRNTSQGVTGGAWDYRTNSAKLQKFWRGGIERMMAKGGRGYESIVTVGMRGDGDEAMTEGTATGLLEGVVADQRAIIADVTGRPAAEQPQIWALYKEVQDYYDHGMKVPDDVTLLFSDDNWGQVRRLPDPSGTQRSGGYGIYYHFDYVGAPRNYKWLNTNQIEKVWQQMDLAYSRGVRTIWIVNVGDIKPMEFPLSFFMAMAWNPDAFTPETLAAYPTVWATANFGAEHARDIGAILTDYSRLAARRKPELINPDSFALGAMSTDALDGGPFGAVVREWDMLEARMTHRRRLLKPEQSNAYYQLVEYPVAAMANLYRLYYAAAWNKKLAAKNDPRANPFADQVEATFARDRDLAARYHQQNGGKWDGMMRQVHMSYVIWNDPTQQTMPSITRVAGDTPADRLARSVKFADLSLPSKSVVSIEATAFDRARNGNGLRWTRIANLGRSKGAVLALPQGRPATVADDQICLEYDVMVGDAGEARVELHLAPTLATSGSGKLQIGVSIDSGAMQTLVVELEPTGGAQDTPAKKAWADAVSDNLHIQSATLGSVDAGKHTIRVWRLDDNVVLQKLVFIVGAAST